MNFEKYENENGQIAVLVSGGYGAGWSTWNLPRDFLAMDKGLVELKLKEASAAEAEAYCQSKGVKGVCTGGWSQVRIEWLAEGTAFTIEEYDGSESLRLISDLCMTA